MSTPQKDKVYWQILDGVIRLEVTKGHLCWKMSDLSRLSGVSRPLIYYYFGKSKEQIVDAALKIIGDEFFGLSAERLLLWEKGDVLESVLRTRELLKKAPHMVEFYFHWRHGDNDVSKQLRQLEERYLEKMVKFRPGKSRAEIEALFAILFGICVFPDLKEDSLRAVMFRLSTW